MRTDGIHLRGAMNEAILKNPYLIILIGYFLQIRL